MGAAVLTTITNRSRQPWGNNKATALRGKGSEPVAKERPEDVDTQVPGK